MKYFSHLRDTQKKTTILQLRIFKNGLEKMPKNLAIEIIKNKNFNDAIIENAEIKRDLKMTKVFRCKKFKLYLPYNFEDFKLKK